MTETAAPEISGQVYLYEQPELLSSEAHANLGLKRIDGPFRFAASASVVPLNVNEFIQAAKTYPIVFSASGDTRPLAVVGLNKNDNLFVDAKGEWEPGVYIPQYVSRHPFVFAHDKESNRFALVIDRKSPAVTDQPDFPFFEDGKLSDFSSRALEFCKEYENQRVGTDAFVKLVGEYGIVGKQQAQVPVGPGGERRDIGEIMTTDEQKLRELPEDAVMDLWRKNYLPFIYAQLTSQTNWRALFERALRKRESNGSGPAAN